MAGGHVQDADDIEEPDERKVKRTPEAVEPVFYHGYPPIVFQDTLRSLQVRHCIDLTPGDGAAALACYKLGIVYLGFTFTAVHAEQLAARLEHEILQAMANEADPLYSARLVGALAGSTGNGTPKPAPAPRRGQKRNKPEPPSVGEDPEPMDDGTGAEPDPDGEEEDLYEWLRRSILKPSHPHYPVLPRHFSNQGFSLIKKREMFVTDNIDLPSHFSFVDVVGCGAYSANQTWQCVGSTQL